MKTFGVLLSAAVLAATTTLTAPPAAAGDRGRDVAAGAALGIIGGVLLGQALAPQPLYAAPPRPVYQEAYPVYAAPPPPVYHAPEVIYEAPRRHAYRRIDVRAAHQDWCEGRYASYDPYDNTWVDRRGRIRDCVSPYNR